MHFTYLALIALLSSPLLVVAVPNLAVRETVSDEYAAQIARTLEQPGVTFDSSVLSARTVEQFSALERKATGANVPAALTKVGTLPTNQIP